MCIATRRSNFTITGIVVVKVHRELQMERQEHMMDLVAKAVLGMVLLTKLKFIINRIFKIN